MSQRDEPVDQTDEKDVLDDDRDETPIEVDEDTMETWAEAYDDLNGAPEGDWDR